MAGAATDGGGGAGSAAGLNEPVRAVLLDFYGTLARAVSFGLTYEDVFASRGLRLDPSDWAGWDRQVYDGQEHVEQSRTRDTYVAWERERLHGVVASYGADDVEGLVDDLHAASKDFTLAAYDDVTPVLSDLRAQGLVVAVCSNWDWDLDRALDQAGLGGAADVVVTSARVGARKPHPRIFTETLRRCGVHASQALFVGDTWEPDVEGPTAMGMWAVHVCRDDRPGPTPALPPGVRRISDLREL